MIYLNIFIDMSIFRLTKKEGKVVIQYKKWMTDSDWTPAGSHFISSQPSGCPFLVKPEPKNNLDRIQQMVEQYHQLAYVSLTQLRFCTLSILAVYYHFSIARFEL